MRKHRPKRSASRPVTRGKTLRLRPESDESAAEQREKQKQAEREQQKREKQKRRRQIAERLAEDGAFRKTYKPRYPCQKDCIHEVRVALAVYTTDKGNTRVERVNAVLSGEVARDLFERGARWVRLDFSYCQRDESCADIRCWQCGRRLQKVSSHYVRAALRSLIDDLGRDPCVF